MSLDLVLFWAAFIAYFAGFIFYTLYISLKSELFGKLGMAAMIVGFIPQTAAFFVRWILAEHAPLSNMYEYMGLMSWMAVLCLFIIVGRYRKQWFGSFIAPIVFMLMVTASLLPKDISQALMPALQSYWLTIHVTLAALGSGSFAVACAVSFIYLYKASSNSKACLFGDKYSTFLAVFWGVLFPVTFALIIKYAGGFSKSEFYFRLSGHEYNGWKGFFTGLGLALPLANFLWYITYHRIISSKSEGKMGSAIFSLVVLCVLVGGLVVGFLIKFGTIHLTEGSAYKLFEFLGVNWLIALLLFYPIYWVLGVKGREYLRTSKISLDLLDEINYKAVSLGYPLFTVGALFAGAIWAEQAWGQFWSWDPKEVGALIIWLFYTGFLHARKQRNWRGSRAAILSIFGLLMILLSFFGNYFFGGLHTYA